MKRLLLVVFFIASWAVAACASEDAELDEFVPTELDDAYATELGSRTFQALVRYADEKEGNRVAYQAEVEFGILPDTQFSISGLWYSGNADREGSGDVSSEILYNFNEGSVYVPATALSVTADFPTGERRSGVELTSKLLFSWQHALHANLIWIRNAGRERETERHDLFKGILGFSTKAGKEMTFIAELVREQKEEKHEEANYLEAGLRRMMTKDVVAAVGAAVGLGADSDRFRVTVAFEYDF